MFSLRPKQLLVAFCILGLLVLAGIWLLPRDGKVTSVVPAPPLTKAVAEATDATPVAHQVATASSEAVTASPAQSPAATAASTPAEPQEAAPARSAEQLTADFRQLQQDARWQQPVAEPELEQFRSWTARFFTAPAAEKSALIGEGVRLAQARRPVIEGLIESNPELALERAVPVTVRRQMPLGVISELEEHVNGRGDLMVLAAVPLPDAANPAKPISRTAEIGGRSFEAFVGHGRARHRSRRNIPVHGVALGEKLAVSDLAGRPLEAGEMTEAKATTTDDKICDVSGLETSANNDEAAIDVGGTVHFYCAKRHAMKELLAMTDEERQQAVGPGRGDVAGSAWTEGTKKLLIIRVDFPDYTGGVAGIAAEQKLSNMVSSSNVNAPQLNAFWEAMSYGKASWAPVGSGSTITPVLRLSGNSDQYTNFQTMLSAARAASSRAGINPDNYDFEMVVTDDRPRVGFAGVAYVGWRGCWLANDVYWNQGVASHELGHNFGLWHSSSWSTTDGTIIGPGNRVEYGDDFDTMGGAESNAESHFNSHYKNFLDWLPNASVRTVTASGTHRILAHDVQSGTGLRALKIARTTSQAYWVETRQLWSSNRWSSNGVHVMWANRSGDDNSELLDMNPLTRTIEDAPLVVGRTFSDIPRGIHITPIAKIPGSPQNAMDVVVNLGTFPGNRKPTLSLTATPVPVAGVISVAPNQQVTFTANAADSETDSLAYYWDFGDDTFGTNSATVSKSWSSVAERVVRCTVSDMKGGTASASLIVRIGNPSTFSINGRVTEDDSSGIEGVRVTAGSAVAVTNTDGSYALVGLNSGSYSVQATSGSRNYLPQGFQNPVVLGPSKSGINFGAAASAPRMSPLPAVTVNLKSPVGPIPFTVEDRDTPLELLTFSATTSNLALLAPKDLVITGTGANRMISITPGTNQTGTGVLQVTVKDADNYTMTREWTITVNAPPSLTLQQFRTNEDATVDMDLWLLATDQQTPKHQLLFSVGNSPQGTVQLLPDGRTARFTPRPDFNGMTSFDMSVTDMSSEPRLFLYYGFEAPDSSADGEAEDTSNFARHGRISAIGGGEFAYVTGDVPANLALYERSTLQLLGTRDGTAARLTRDILPNELDFNNQDWSFACWFRRDGLENDDVIFHLGDGAGSGAPGELVVTGVAEDEKIAFSAAGVTTLLQPRIGAGDWHHVAVTFSRTAPNMGILNVYLNGVLAHTASGVALGVSQEVPVVFGGHSGTTERTDRWLNGRLDEVAIWSVSLTAAEVARLPLMVVPHFSGSSKTAAVQIFVNEVNDGPAISQISDQAINEDGVLGPLNFTLNDDNIPVNNLTLRLQSSNPALVPASALMLGGSGANRTLTVRPVANRSGSAVITIFASDGTLTTERSFTLTVTEISDAPELSTFSGLTMPQNGARVLVPFELKDVDTLGSGLMVTAVSSNPQLFPEENLIFEGTAGTRGLLVTPAPGHSGSATITVTVTDGTTTLTRTFTVNVAAAAFTGVWNGLIASEPAVHSGMGLINIKTSVSGEFTARVVRGGARDSFKGAIPTTGLSGPIRSKSGKLTMQLERATDGKLSGSITDGATTSAFEADRALFTAKSPLPPQRSVPAAWLGRVTVLLQPSGENAPAGAGYAAVTVLTNGTLRAVGKLPNGSGFAYGNALSQEGSTPLYVSLDKGAGALAGMMKWAPTDATDWAGEMRWFRAGAPAAGVPLDLLGSRYLPPQVGKSGAPSVMPLPGMSAEDGNGNVQISLTQPTMTKAANLSAAGKFAIIGSNSEGLGLKLSPSTGVLSGSFTAPTAGKARVGGVLFQKTDRAAGFHSSGTQTGGFAMEVLN